MRIYVASSWLNQYQPQIVQLLRSRGNEVYDFRNPALGNNGFHWSEIDPGWKDWTAERFIRGLEHPIAAAGFARDKDALDWCECCVLVLPSGRSAHLELGYCIGQGKPGLIFIPYYGHIEPELMYKLGTVCVGCNDLLAKIVRAERDVPADAEGRPT